MRRIVFALVGVGAFAGAVATKGPILRTIGRRGRADLRDQVSEGFSAAQHGPPLLRLVAMRWRAGSHS
jgi:hypothetical protein